MTPAIAIRRVGPNALLVQRPHSLVVHVADPRLRRARRVPVCHQRGKRWGTTTTPGTRRLCSRCERRVLRSTTSVELTPQELADWAAAATTIPELDQVVNAIVMAGHVMTHAVLVGTREGQKVSRLHNHVVSARLRILGPAFYERRRFA